jgi:hypothetical protein
MTTANAYKRRLRKLLLNASEAQRVDGMRWYDKARDDIATMADTHGFSPVVAADVVAALSPACVWERNLVDAGNMMAAARNITPRPRVSTYGPMADKAWKIAGGLADLAQVTTAKATKVRAFADNLKAAGSTAVVVDRWIVRAAEGIADIDTNQSVSPKQYREISAAIKALAVEYDLMPYQVQAIIWIVVRPEKSNAYKEN